MNRATRHRFAEHYIINALNVQPGELVHIVTRGPKTLELAKYCGDLTERRGARFVFVDEWGPSLTDKFKNYTPSDFVAWGKSELNKNKKMQAYLRIDADAEDEEIDILPKNITLYHQARYASTDYRVNHTRWLVVNVATETLAKQAHLSLKAFEHLHARSCLLNYKKMAEAVAPLQQLMEKAKDVHIKSSAQNTDLRFSIAGIPAIPCVGTLNLPDGECFTAPIKDSVNGTISFINSPYHGDALGPIHLTFKSGQIINAKAQTKKATRRLNEILDIDEGSRYVGEFALGFNPFLTRPIGSILFDEKLCYSLHMAMGHCYSTAPNGNQSANHWDMIHLQSRAYGGGELWFDSKLIRRDGIFLPPALRPLNRTNLIKVTRQLRR